MATLIQKTDTIRYHAEQIGRLVNEWANECTSPERSKAIAKEVKIRRKVIKQLQKSN